jgi:hypothetical protein
MQSHFSSNSFAVVHHLCPCCSATDRTSCQVIPPILLPVAIPPPISTLDCTNAVDASSPDRSVCTAESSQRDCTPRASSPAPPSDTCMGLTGTAGGNSQPPPASTPRSQTPWTGGVNAHVVEAIGRPAHCRGMHLLEPTPLECGGLTETRGIMWHERWVMASDPEQ